MFSRSGPVRTPMTCSSFESSLYATSRSCERTPPYRSAHATGDRIPRLLDCEELARHTDRVGRHSGRVLRRGLALLLTRTNLSVSAAMGFVSIFGIAVQDTLLVVTYAQRLWRSQQHSLVASAELAARRRLRPVLTTASVALIGLLPAAMSRGIGSETQKPLAIVVIGGAMVLALLPRLLQPALFLLAHGRERAPTPAAATAPA